jgi:bacillolysin
MVKLGRSFIIVTLLLLTIGLVSNAIFAAPPTISADLKARLERQAGGTVRIHTDPISGLARYVEAGDLALTSEFAGKFATPEETARAFMSTYGSLFAIRDASQLQTTSVKTDELGMTHVRFAQMQGGISVFGGDLIVHLNADGSVASVNGVTVGGLDTLSTQVSLSEADADKAALSQLAIVGDATVTEKSVVILNPSVITDQPSGTYLTYRVRVDSESRPDLAKYVFVDAQSGEVRFSYPAVYEVRNRRTYNMRRSTSYANALLVRSEGQGNVTTASNCTVADINNAHNYAGNTYDFFYNRYGRDSYNNAGAALNSYVCYGTNYQNAFWDGSRMTYGDGFAAADDVVAHELSHGVTEYASGLIYSYQSGALNESYSDIFGEAVDLTNSSGSDGSSVRWDMGEDIPGIGAIRDMADPGRFGDPDRTNSSNYYCGSGDSGGVHINSGVPNKAYTLLVDGGSFNGKTITSIGLDAASAINYRTNEVYLTSSSNFLANYNQLIRSCGDLYGSTSNTCTQVRNALEAVRMNGSICGSGGATATPGGGGSPTATPGGGGGGTTYTGTLSGTGANAYQPNNSYYTSNVSGTHTGSLTGPSGTDFDLYLQKWNGSSWATVRSGTGSTSTEYVSYSGTSGYYRWRIYSYSGSGSYTLVTTRPAGLTQDPIIERAPVDGAPEDAAVDKK